MCDLLSPLFRGGEERGPRLALSLRECFKSRGNKRSFGWSVGKGRTVQGLPHPRTPPPPIGGPPRLLAHCPRAKVHGATTTLPSLRRSLRGWTHPRTSGCLQDGGARAFLRRPGIRFLPHLESQPRGLFIFSSPTFHTSLICIEHLSHWLLPSLLSPPCPYICALLPFSCFLLFQRLCSSSFPISLFLSSLHTRARSLGGARVNHRDVEEKDLGIADRGRDHDDASARERGG